METRGNWARRRWNKVADTLEKEPGIGVSRSGHGAPSRRKIMHLLQKRDSEEKAASERWRWNSFRQQPTTPRALVTDHSLSVPSLDVSSTIARYEDRGESIYRGGPPATPPVGYGTQKRLSTDLQSMNLDYTQGDLESEDQAIQREQHDDAAGPVHFNEHEGVCLNSLGWVSAEGDELAQGAQEEDERDICSEIFRVTDHKNRLCPLPWSTNSNEGLQVCEANACAWLEEEERCGAPHGGTSVADKQSALLLARDVLRRSKNAAHSRTTAPHRNNESSTTATSCPHSPRENDKMSAFFSATAAAKNAQGDLDTTGIASIADPLASSGDIVGRLPICSAKTGGSAEPAEPLNVVTSPEYDEAERDTVSNVGACGAAIVAGTHHRRSDELSEDALQPDDLASDTVSVCRSVSALGGGYASHLAHTPPSVVTFLEASATAQRSEVETKASAATKTFVKKRSLVPFRGSYLARFTVPFSGQRLRPRAEKSGVIHPASVQTSRSHPSVTAYAYCPQQEDAVATKECFLHGELPSAQSSLQDSRTQKVFLKKQQQEEEKRWHPQQQRRSRLQQAKFLRLFSRDRFSDRAHAQRGRAQQESCTASYEIEESLFSDQQRFNPLMMAAGARAKSGPASVSVACRPEVPAMATAVPTVGKAPTRTSIIAAETLRRRAKGLSTERQTAATSKSSVLRKLLKLGVLENAGEGLSSAATRVATTPPSHDDAPVKSRPFQWLQTHNDRDGQADASGVSPPSAESYKRLLHSQPCAGPAAAQAVGTSTTSHNMIRRRPRGSTVSSCSSSEYCLQSRTAASSHSCQAATHAQPGATVGTEEPESETTPVFSTVVSSPIFAGLVTTNQIADCASDPSAGHGTPTFATVATQHHTDRFSQQPGLSFPAGSNSLHPPPSRTHSSPEGQSLSCGKALSCREQHRRTSMPLDQPASKIREEQRINWTILKEKGGRHLNNNSSDGDSETPVRNVTVNTFQNICKSDADVGIQRSALTAEELNNEKAKASSTDVPLCRSTATSVAGLHLVQNTAVLSKTNRFFDEHLVDAVTGSNAATDQKHAVRQIVQQTPAHISQPRQPPYGGRDVLDGVVELHHGQRSSRDGNVCNDFSIKDPVDAPAHEQTGTHYNGVVNTSSPQRLFVLAGREKLCTEACTGDSAISLTRSGRTADSLDDIDELEAPASEGDCLSTGERYNEAPGSSSMNSNAPASAVAIVLDNVVLTEGHGVPQSEQRHAPPLDDEQQAKTPQKQQQQLKAQQPIVNNDESQERQQKGAHLASSETPFNSHRPLFAASSHPPQGMASTDEEQPNNELCIDEHRRESRPQEISVSAHVCPPHKPPGNLSALERTVCAADLPKHAVSVSPSEEAAVVAANNEGESRSPALQEDTLAAASVSPNCVSGERDSQQYHPQKNLPHPSRGVVVETVRVHSSADVGCCAPTASIPTGNGDTTEAGGIGIAAAAASSAGSTSTQLSAGAKDAAADTDHDHGVILSTAKGKSVEEGDGLVKEAGQTIELPLAAPTCSSGENSRDATVAIQGGAKSATATFSEAFSVPTVSATAPGDVASTTSITVTGVMPLNTDAEKIRKATTEVCHNNPHSSSVATPCVAAPSVSTQNVKPEPLVSGSAPPLGIKQDKQEALTLTETVLATLGHGVTAALEYGAATLRDFITESLPALSSDEDSSPANSLVRRCSSTQDRRRSTSLCGGSGGPMSTQERSKEETLRGQQRSRSIRRACSAGAVTGAAKPLQPRWDPVNSSVLLPPPLLLRECLQLSVAGLKQKNSGGLPPPPSSTSSNQSHGRSNSFSEAACRRQPDPGWYNGGAFESYRSPLRSRPPSPWLLPDRYTSLRAVINNRATNVATAADAAISHLNPCVRPATPILSAPPSVYRQQLSDGGGTLQMRRYAEAVLHPAAAHPPASAEIRRPPSAFIPSSDHPRLPHTPTRESSRSPMHQWSHSAVHRWSQASPVSCTSSLGACSAFVPALNGAALPSPGRNHPLHTKSGGSGLRVWQVPSRVVCSPSAATTATGRRSGFTTPVNSSHFHARHALSPAQSAQVGIHPTPPTKGVVDCAPLAVEGLHTAGTAPDNNNTIVRKSPQFCAAASETVNQRGRRSCVSMPPILPKSTQRNTNVFSLPHAWQQQQQQQQTSCLTWQDSTFRNGRISPAHIVSGARCISPLPATADLLLYTGSHGKAENCSSTQHRRHAQQPQQQPHREPEQQHNQQRQVEAQHKPPEGVQQQHGMAPELPNTLADANESTVMASPAYQSGSSSCHNSGSLRKTSVSNDMRNHSASSHFTRDPSPQGPYYRATSHQQQQTNTEHEPHRLLQPPSCLYPTPQPCAVLPEAVCFQKPAPQLNPATITFPAPANATGDLHFEQPPRRLPICNTAAKAIPLHAAVSFVPTASECAPVPVRPQELLLNASTARSSDWAKKDNSTPGYFVNVGLGMPCSEGPDRRPLEYTTSQQLRPPQVEISPASSSHAPLDGRGNTVRAKQQRSTVFESTAGCVAGTSHIDSGSIFAEETRGRTPLQRAQNESSENSIWKFVQPHRQQCMQQNVLPTDQPFSFSTAPATGRCREALQAADQVAGRPISTEEPPTPMATPPQTHRGGRVATATANEMEQAVYSVAPDSECTAWKTSFSECHLVTGAKEESHSTLSTTEAGSRKAASTGKGAVIASPKTVCVQLERDTTEQGIAYKTAAPSCARRAIASTGNPHPPEATAEVGTQLEARQSDTAKGCLRPLWKRQQVGLLNMQSNLQQLDSTQHRPVVSKPLQRPQHLGAAQRPRPPSPIRARWLREELLRQRAMGQLNKDNFPLEEVETLLQGFGVRKVNGVLIYDVEGREALTATQSESAAASPGGFSLPNSSTPSGFGSNSTAEPQLAVRNERHVKGSRLTSTLDLHAKYNGLYDNSSSSSGDLQADAMCCSNSNDFNSIPYGGRPGGSAGSQSKAESSRQDSQDTQRNPHFDTWLRENHRLGEQFLRDVKQIVDVAASIYGRDETYE